VLTKSGGNVYHGALLSFSAMTFWMPPVLIHGQHQAKSPFKWNDYGFELDVPSAFKGV